MLQLLANALVLPLPLRAPADPDRWLAPSTAPPAGTAAGGMAIPEDTAEVTAATAARSLVVPPPASDAVAACTSAQQPPSRTPKAMVGSRSRVVINTPTAAKVYAATDVIADVDEVDAASLPASIPSTPAVPPVAGPALAAAQGQRRVQGRDICHDGQKRGQEHGARDFVGACCDRRVCVHNPGVGRHFYLDIVGATTMCLSPLLFYWTFAIVGGGVRFSSTAVRPSWGRCALWGVSTALHRCPMLWTPR